MAATTLPVGTVTLLFSDIEGSTVLLKRLGDGWPGVLERQRTLLRGAVERAGGVVVDCQGDAMFAAFGAARAGVDAAVEIQAGLAGEPWPNGTAVRVRIALHTGEPHVSEDGGYTGIDVVRAARLCSAGHGGQVLLTEPVRMLAGVETCDLGATRLRDLDDSERVYQLVAPGLAKTFPPLRTNAASPLDEMSGENGFEERIKRAEATLEQRIQDHVASSIERAFNAPLDRKRDQS
jgi:class 3 adenylate cyclase